MLATRVPELAAGVPFYGSAPNSEDVPKIKASLVIQSAEVDERINASWPAYEAALKASPTSTRTSASLIRGARRSDGFFYVLLNCYTAGSAGAGGGTT
jgi:dienelactone hydrolase